MSEDITKEELEKIFRGIACNRSIKKLIFRYNSLFDGELFNIMLPFFKNNHNFECLELDGCHLEHECRLPFLSALAEFDSLKELNFFRCQIDNDNEARELIGALTGHSGLKKLMLCDVWIGWNGCAVLSTLLQNPELELIVLEL